MPTKPRPESPLTASQQRLVLANLGLVGVHLKRFVRSLRDRGRDSEWDDLFQEGCLGLIHAARTYRPKSGISFPAYALPRIHCAVSRAMKRDPSAHGLKFQHLIEEPAEPGHRYRAGDPDRPTAETVGRRLRGKYERAVRTAGRHEADKGRRDRRRLVRALSAERLMIPEPSSKTTLRQIARDTRCSYSRTTKCDTQLEGAVRRALEADPEFEALRRCRRASPEGMEAPIDAPLEQALAGASAREFLQRFRTADSGRQAGLLRAYFRVSGRDIDGLLEEGIRSLPPIMREKLLTETGEKGRRQSQ